MQTRVLDAELRAKLNGPTDQVDLTDEVGNVVGHYLTHEEYVRLRYAEAKARFSEEEIERARREVRETGGLTTADVLARLRELDRTLSGGT